MVAHSSAAAQSRLSSFWVMTLIQLGGWSTYGLSTFLSLLPVMPPEQHGVMLAAKWTRAGIGMAASYVLLALYRWLGQRRPPIGVIVISAWTASTVLGILWMTAFQQVIPSALAGAARLEGERSAAALAAALESHFVVGTRVEMIFVLLAWSGMYYTIVHWLELQERERQTLQATQVAQRAQVDMLSYQINPHFLFNALNSIRALIAENPARAKEMVTQLAVFLRYTLAADPTRHFTVAEEFEMVDGYLAIEGIRFEERLDAQSYMDPEVAGWPIPRFIVHPLVENAVKHGRAAAGEALRVRVRAERVGDAMLAISVTNTGELVRGGPTSEHGLGVGWRNIRQRLELLYGGAARFDVAERDGLVEVTIRLPSSIPAAAVPAVQHA